MRSRVWILLLWIHCLALAAAAQSPASRQIILPVATGGFGSFTSATPAPAKSPMLDSSPSSLLLAQAVAGEDRVIQRVLTDAESRVLFAYELAINSDPLPKKFN